MHVINSLIATSSNPYRNEAINKIYNQLFCDNIELYLSPANAADYPWNILGSDNPDIDGLKAIIDDNSLQTRHKILAYNLLAVNGVPAERKELMGVIVEVSLPGGLDVLAAYQDGTARYINYIEKLLVWETETGQSTDLVSKLFSDSSIVVSRIGPWDKERCPFPVNDKIRLSFLVSDGLYFGEGPFDVFQKDQLAGPVINSASELMTYLIDTALSKK